MNTVKNTNWLRGVSILVVVIHHYLLHYPIPGNQIVSLFFILSGYGLYYSFSKISLPFSIEKITTFYRKRFLRIYPLWWIAMAVAFLHGYSHESSMYEFLKDFFLIRVVGSHTWFLNAILQCYLLSPLIYIVVSRFRLLAILIFTVVMALCIPICDSVLSIPNLPAYSYRGVYFLHVYLFSLGMILPLVKAKGDSKYAWLTLFCLAFVAASDLTGQKYFVNFVDYTISVIYFKLNANIMLFVITSLLLSWYVINYNRPLPLMSLFCLAGKASLPIYIFHGYLFEVLGYVEDGVGVESVYLKVLFFGVAFVVFSYVCLRLQAATQHVANLVLVRRAARAG